MTAQQASNISMLHKSNQASIKSIEAKIQVAVNSGRFELSIQHYDLKMTQATLRGIGKYFSEKGYQFCINQDFVNISWAGFY